MPRVNYARVRKSPWSSQIMPRSNGLHDNMKHQSVEWKCSTCPGTRTMTYEHSFSQSTIEENNSPWFSRSKEWPAGVAQNTHLYWILCEPKACTIYAGDNQAVLLIRLNRKKKIHNNCHLTKEAALAFFLK